MQPSASWAMLAIIIKLPRVDNPFSSCETSRPLDIRSLTKLLSRWRGQSSKVSRRRRCGDIRIPRWLCARAKVAAVRIVSELNSICAHIEIIIAIYLFISMKEKANEEVLCCVQHGMGCHHRRDGRRVPDDRPGPGQARGRPEEGRHCQAALCSA